jgi:hypothetical protein
VPRYHGRKGRLYMGLANDSAVAEPVAYLRSWSISLATDRVEVTAFGDTNRVYVAGLPDASGDYAGYWDSASAQMYTAATDGLARRFYLYQTTDVATEYFFGTAFFDFSMNGAVDGAVEISGSWQAASSVSLVS